MSQDTEWRIRLNNARERAKNSSSKKREVAKRMGPGSPSKGGSVTYSGHHAHDKKHKLPSNNILRPKPYKRNESDYY